MMSLLAEDIIVWSPRSQSTAIMIVLATPVLNNQGSVKGSLLPQA